MSSVALPEMKKYNYHPMLSAGSVVAGSTLGVMIPPSIVLVVYAIYTGQSIGKLFFGNVIPSAILTILIAATVIYICYRHPDWGPKGPKSTWKERFKALPDAIDIVILFLIIMVALFTGVGNSHRGCGSKQRGGPDYLYYKKKTDMEGICCILC